MTPRKEIAYRRYTPVGDRIVVIPDPPKTMSDGGMIVPGMAQEAQPTGTVEAVSDQVPSDLVGKRVCWGDMFAARVHKDVKGKDRVILRYPVEVLFLYEDTTRPETDAEYHARLEQEESDAESAETMAKVKAEHAARIAASMGAE